MFDIIFAGIDKKDGTIGIGLNSRLPWKSLEELELFKNITMGHILIFGKKTLLNLPRLEGRTIYCLSNNTKLKTNLFKNNVKISNNFIEIINECKNIYPDKKIFVAGGGKVYDLVFEKYKKMIDNVYVSFIKKDYHCDTFITKFNLREYTIENLTEYKDFTHYTLNTNTTQEKVYLDLLQDVLINGNLRETRNGETKGVFCRHLSFDLRKSFPLLTTKKMFFRGIVEELLFFLRGDTDTKILEEKGINIWKKNTDRKFLDENNFENRKDGLMGPMYGWQWRSFNETYNEETGKPNYTGVDQFKLLIEEIKSDPHSRRLIMTDYNPLQREQGVLYPCHSIVCQFYVESGYIDMFCYNRSSDLFLGLPFNIASSALLLHIIGEMTELIPRHLHISLGDAHIYSSHIPAVQEQLSRLCYVMPQLKINKIIDDVNNLEFSDFELIDYNYNPNIKSEMIA